MDSAPKYIPSIYFVYTYTAEEKAFRDVAFCYVCWLVGSSSWKDHTKSVEIQHDHTSITSFSGHKFQNLPYMWYFAFKCLWKTKKTKL